MEEMLTVRLDLGPYAKVALAVIVICVVALVLLRLQKLVAERRAAEQLAAAGNIPFPVVGFTAPPTGKA